MAAWCIGTGSLSLALLFKGGTPLGVVFLGSAALALPLNFFILGFWDMLHPGADFGSIWEGMSLLVGGGLGAATGVLVAQRLHGAWWAIVLAVVIGGFILVQMQTLLIRVAEDLGVQPPRNKRLYEIGFAWSAAQKWRESNAPDPRQCTGGHLLAMGEEICRFCGLPPSGDA